jgi:hypothetical protein
MSTAPHDYFDCPNDLRVCDTCDSSVRADRARLAELESACAQAVAEAALLAERIDSALSSKNHEAMYVILRMAQKATQQPRAQEAGEHDG